MNNMDKMWKLLCKNIVKGFESVYKGAVNYKLLERNEEGTNVPFALGFKEKITRDGKWIESGYFWQRNSVNNGLGV